MAAEGAVSRMPQAAGPAAAPTPAPEDQYKRSTISCTSSRTFGSRRSGGKNTTSSCRPTTHAPMAPGGSGGSVGSAAQSAAPAAAPLAAGEAVARIPQAAAPTHAPMANHQSPTEKATDSTQAAAKRPIPSPAGGQGAAGGAVASPAQPTAPTHAIAAGPLAAGGAAESVGSAPQAAGPATAPLAPGAPEDQ